ncbi:MAG: ABC transporter ATP-binding protein [Propionivibrio sp.]
MLTATDLSKRYGSFIAADALTFTIGKGEVIGLLGTNGAGKSTTMNLLTGCLPPSSGTVTICGHNLHDEPLRAKRHIGYLPEIPPLYMDMSVDEQLTFAARLRRVDKTLLRAEIDRVCELANVTDVRRRLIEQLSKGYRQRVGLAQALVGSPELLILDEPTAGLDPKQILDMRELIATLRERHTIVISSHILAEIASLCSRLLILKQGRLVADATPEQLGQAHGGGQLQVRVKASVERAREVVAAVSGVTDLQAHASPEAGYADVLVGGLDNSEQRAALSMALAQAGCPAVMIKPAGATLEEVFIRLTA